METDLNRQLQELEQQEQEQYNLLEQTLALELNCNDYQPCMFDIDETKKQLQHIEKLKQYEQNEQQREYNLILQQLKQYEQLETIQINQQVNISYS
jgi:histidyl-tRNA synthetase